MKERIYFDNNATTFLDPRVRRVMQEALEQKFGNPSSIHSFGQEARHALVEAREKVANYFRVAPNEVVFTSGGTEALNMVIRGLLCKEMKGEIITTNVEHSAVYNTVNELKSKGCSVNFLPVGKKGAPTPEAIREAIGPETKLIILMAANNETGAKINMEAIAKIALEREIPFVVDGVAIMGKEAFSLPKGVSAFCCSGHKFHGPKGVGIAIVRKKVRCQPILTGGGQEYHRRAGTENLIGILGIAEAVAILDEGISAEVEKMKNLRDLFEKKLIDQIPEIKINGKESRTCNVSSVTFPNIDGETLLMNLDQAGLAASLGSACSAGALEPSRILINMGLSYQEAASSIRFSICRTTTEEEVEKAASIVLNVVAAVA